MTQSTVLCCKSPRWGIGVTDIYIKSKLVKTDSLERALEHVQRAPPVIQSVRREAGSIMGMVGIHLAVGRHTLATINNILISGLISSTEEAKHIL